MRMFFVVCALCLARTPVVLVPGAFRSRLVINTTRNTAWYCPARLTNSQFWVRLSYFVPPILNCFVDWMTVELDPETDTLRNRENVSIDALNFGGVDGVYSTGPGLFGFYVLAYYKQIVRQLKRVGYRAQHDVFGAPYDWRFGAAQPDSHFERFKALIEHAYELNKERVVVISHSLGCQITNRLLTEKTTPEWRKKYIENIVYVAPSWSGAGTVIDAIWWAQMGPLRKLKGLRDMLQSLGTLHIHMPHVLGYEDATVFVDQRGQEYGPGQLMNVLLKNGRMDETKLKIAEKNTKFIKEWPQAPDVKTSILYNSGIPTRMGLNLSRWKTIGTQIYDSGDGLVGSRVIEWVCKNWNNHLKCVDVASPRFGHRHKYLLSTSDTRDTILELALGNITLQQMPTEDL